MTKKTYHDTASYYSDMLGKVRDDIFDSIRGALDWLGGRVCIEHYHEWANTDRYTFFDVDENGHGVEYFLHTITAQEDGEIEIMAHDSEDTYNAYWELSDFNVSDALHLLKELESIIEYIQQTKEKVVRDYDPDYEPKED